MPPRTVPGVAVPMASGPADRVTTRPWVAPCQITGPVPIKGRRSEPVAIAPCFYPMAPAVNPARTYTVTDPLTGVVFKSRRKSRPHGAVIIDGPNGPRVDAWAGRPDLLATYHRRAVKGTWYAAPQASARVALATESHPVTRPRLPRTLAQLTAHPWVEEVSDERSMGAGIWVYLRPGFVTHDCCHTIHETTVKECCRAFRFVSHDPEDYLLKDQATPAPAAPAPRPVLPGEATPPPAPSHGDAAPSLPELRADTAAGRRRLHPMAEILLMRLAATPEPSLAVERFPLWDALAESGWIEMIRVGRMQEGEWCECRITEAGRAVLAARPSA